MSLLSLYRHFLTYTVHLQATTEKGGVNVDWVRMITAITATFSEPTNMPHEYETPKILVKVKIQEHVKVQKCLMKMRLEETLKVF